MSECKPTISTETYDADVILKAQFPELKESESLLTFVKNTFYEYCGELKHIKKIPKKETIYEYMEILNKIDEDIKLDVDEIKKFKEMSELVKLFLPIFEKEVKAITPLTSKQYSIIVSNFVKTAKLPMKGFEVEDLEEQKRSVRSRINDFQSDLGNGYMKPTKASKLRLTGGADPITWGAIFGALSLSFVIILCYSFGKTISDRLQRRAAAKKYESQNNDKTDNSVNVDEVMVNSEILIPVGEYKVHRALNATGIILTNVLYQASDAINAANEIANQTVETMAEEKFMNEFGQNICETTGQVADIVEHVFSCFSGGSGKKSRRKQNKSKRRRRRQKSKRRKLIA